MQNGLSWRRRSAGVGAGAGVGVGVKLARGRVRALVLAAVAAGAGLWGGCVTTPSGQYLCKEPEECPCEPGGRDHGAVVVRWRLADLRVGRLLTRGDCCCNPDPAPSETLRGQCSSFGSQCLDSPAWLVRKVQLVISPPPQTPEGAPRTQTSCVITAPCTDGELTTPYCFVPGEYDLQLRADIETLPLTDMGQATEFMCPDNLSERQAVTPAALRREVKGGQALNLDGIVLGINARNGPR